MKIKLTPKTAKATDIITKHGDIFNVREVTYDSEQLGLTPMFRIHSLDLTNYMPFLGYRPYWFWLACQNDENFDYEVVK